VGWAVAVQIRSCGCGLGLGGTELWLWAEPATNPARAQAERSDLVCDHEFKVFQTLLDHPGLFASGPILEQAWIVHPIDYNRPHCSCSFTWQPLEVSRRTYSRAIGSKIGLHRFYQKLIKLIENRSKFKFQTFRWLKPVSTGKPVGISDKSVDITGLSVPKSINRYKFKFFKNPLKSGKNIIKN
jgi:hypothetical protein